MKKLKVKWKRAQIHELNDRLLLYNLYLTQGLTLLVGAIWIIFQKRN
ncbi:CPBP family intramembrane metalloprotease, partial [Paenibacillus sp. 28ISP30-2]|nr:CPBP family intramembrane metalloprotease [Paenibacillus sp. 28ISP30-2]